MALTQNQSPNNPGLYFFCLNCRVCDSPCSSHCCCKPCSRMLRWQYCKMREPLLAGAWGISGSRDSPQTSTAQTAGAETKLHRFKQCGVYFCSLPHITTWPNLSGTYRLVATLYFFSMFSMGSYMARSFIIDDFHWMLNVFHCKHFLAFLHIFGNLIPISAILPSPPKRHHLFIQNIFISCLLES